MSEAHLNTGFETPEHELLGSLGFTAAAAKLSAAAKAAGASLKINDAGVSMPFGRLVAFAGDFMGPEGNEKPLCDLKKEKAKLAIDAWRKKFRASQYQYLVQASQAEEKAVAAAMKAGHPAEFALSGEAGDGITQDFIRATLGQKPSKHSKLAYYEHALKDSPYLNLAKRNFDHFLDAGCSRRAYQNCHQLAHDEAKKGNHNEALVYEAWGLHFLTDRFAAGHIRTPRQALTYCNGKFPLGDAMSKCQHDEDNAWGLTVENGRASSEKGRSWVAYGDARLLNSNNNVNKNNAVAAVAASIREIYGAALPAGPAAAEAFAPYRIVDVVGKEPMFKRGGKDNTQILARTPLERKGHGEVKYELVNSDDLCVARLLECWSFTPSLNSVLDKGAYLYLTARKEALAAMKKVESLAEKTKDGLVKGASDFLNKLPGQ